MNRILLSLFLLLCAHPSFAVTAKPVPWAQDLETAQAALDAKDYPTAYKLYQQQADRNPLAQFVLGQFHRNGWGRDPDPAGACTWFEKAAQKRIPTAEHFWGDCLAQGIGRAPDIPAALEWYEKAAADGHLLSRCSAADFYIQGRGVAKDVKRGIEMCMQVALANSPPAMLKLARYFEQGEFVSQDLIAARHWYERAAQRNMAEAQYRLGVMLGRGQGGEADPNTALFWLETAASSGYAPAYLPTAMLYANAPTQEKTGALAPEHLAKIYLWATAAKAGSTDSAQQAEALKLQAQVMSVMPASWQPDLDKKVAEHLARHPINP